MRFESGACVLVILAVFASACRYEQVEEDDDAAAATSQMPPPPVQSAAPVLPDAPRDLHFLVDLSDRKLYVLSATDTLRVEEVAVGKRSHPTPTGEWRIDRVDFNPDWTPPPGEEWTEDEEYQPPGSPDNPMGRARLVFNPPFTIHGTKERESLGMATSHGSIRVANEVVIPLARLVLDAGGASKPESFYQQVAANRTVMQQVDIPRPVPITVQK